MMTRPEHRGTLIFFLAPCLVITTLACGSPPVENDDISTGPPNIVLFLADDHGQWAAGPYGNKEVETPSLDTLAASGVLMADATSPSPVCSPARVSLLTGRMPSQHGVHDFLSEQPDFDHDWLAGEVLLPELLQQAGYRTALIGKWHCTATSVKPERGFDRWLSYDQGPEGWPNQYLHQGTVHLSDQGSPISVDGFQLEYLGRAAREFIASGDPEQPYFVLFAPTDAHSPFEGHPENWVERYRNASLNEIPVGEASAFPAANAESVAPEDLHETLAQYYAAVSHQDAELAKILDLVEARGGLNNTLVIYTADQGFFLGEHGLYDKRFMYEESIRIPFLVRWPRAVKPGSVDDHIVLNVDFAPTFLDLAGLPTPKDMHGRSLEPLLLGKAPADWRTSFYYHYYEFPGAHSVRRHYGIRTTRYKLIHYYRIGEWELFDLERDPHELRNVYSDPAYAPIVAKLKTELERLRKDLAVPEDSDLRGLPKELRPVVGPQLVLTFDGKRPFADSSPAKRRLTATGVKLVEGRKGKAALFDGKTSVLDLPRGACPAPRLTQITIMAWLKPSKPDGVILAHGGNAWGYCLHLVGGKPAFSARVNKALATVVAKEKLPNGWTHVAGTLAKGGRIAIYVNGRQVARGKAPALLGADPYDNLQIGVDAGSPILDDQRSREHYGGLLDDLKLIYGPITAAQIAKESK